VPQAFDCLRHVPLYSDFIKERFERCLDLYLCPRCVDSHRLAAIVICIVELQYKCMTSSRSALERCLVLYLSPRWGASWASWVTLLQSLVVVACCMLCAAPEHISADRYCSRPCSSNTAVLLERHSRHQQR
jgi:hypothetical protein